MKNTDESEKLHKKLETEVAKSILTKLGYVVGYAHDYLISGNENEINKLYIQPSGISGSFKNIHVEVTVGRTPKSGLVSWEINRLLKERKVVSISFPPLAFLFGENEDESKLFGAKVEFYSLEDNEVYVKEDPFVLSNDDKVMRLRKEFKKEWSFLKSLHDED